MSLDHGAVTLASVNSRSAGITKSKTKEDHSVIIEAELY